MGETRRQITQIHQTLASMRSAIKCGEQWSGTLQEEYTGAIKVLDKFDLFDTAAAAPSAEEGEGPNGAQRVLAAVTCWLEANKPEVFREGLWDAVRAVRTPDQSEGEREKGKLWPFLPDPAETQKDSLANWTAREIEAVNTAIDALLWRVKTLEDAVKAKPSYADLIRESLEEAVEIKRDTAEPQGEPDACAPEWAHDALTDLAGQQEADGNGGTALLLRRIRNSIRFDRHPPAQGDDVEELRKERDHWKGIALDWKAEARRAQRVAAQGDTVSREEYEELERRRYRDLNLLEKTLKELAESPRAAQGVPVEVMERAMKWVLPPSDGPQLQEFEEDEEFIRSHLDGAQPQDIPREVVQELVETAFREGHQRGRHASSGIATEDKAWENSNALAALRPHLEQGGEG